MSCSLWLPMNSSPVPVSYCVLLPAKGCSGTRNSSLIEGINNSRVGGVENRLYSKFVYTFWEKEKQVMAQKTIGIFLVLWLAFDCLTVFTYGLCFALGIRRNCFNLRSR